MTALTEARKNTKRRDGIVYPFKVAASTTIYEGALVSTNAAGYLVNATDAASDVVVGVADETVVNVAAGAKKCNVLRTGVFQFTYAGTATIADVNTLVYVVDNQTVDLAADMTNDVLVGRIVDVIDATTVAVDIRDRA